MLVLKYIYKIISVKISNNNLKILAKIKNHKNLKIIAEKAKIIETYRKI